jgi:hypothetical protein
MFKHRPTQLTRINIMSRSKSNKGNTPDLAKVEKEEAEAAAAKVVMEKEEAEAIAARASFEKAQAAKSIKTVTLLLGSKITDPGTGVILIKNKTVIVPEISKWVRMQSKFIPPYLTFTE